MKIKAIFFAKLCVMIGLMSEEFNNIYEELSLLNEAGYYNTASEVDDSYVLSVYNSLASFDPKDVMDCFFEQNGKVYIPWTTLTSTNLFIDNKAAQAEFWKLIELIVKSKHNRNKNDKLQTQANWVNRLINFFFKPALTEQAILDALQKKLPNFNFKFNGDTFGSYNEHEVLFSGKGSDTPDIISEKFNNITIECKSEKSFDSKLDNPHNPTFIALYNSNYSGHNGTFKLIPCTDILSLPDLADKEKEMLNELVNSSSSYTISNDKIVLPSLKEI